MQEFHEGDLVEAVKGGNRIEGAFRPTDQAGYAWVGTVRIDDFPNWAITVIEKATPPLPTESGAVVRVSNEGDRWHWLFWRTTNGEWDGLDFRGKAFYGLADPLGWIREQGEAVSTIERLEPVPVTAKRIIDWAESSEWSWGSMKDSPFLKAIAAEFGVTE